jgi:hypothetical protein
MDVFHKILLKVYEITGGRENAQADLTDLLKREGFLASIDNINDHLCGEGWVTGTDRQYVVRMTHWGVAEAKRTLADAPDKNSVISKDAARLLSSTRELVIMLEEFSADPSQDKFKVLEKRFSDLGGIVGKIGANY